MLFRFVGKLLFKASLPLILIAGLLSYNSYQNGGDPAAYLKGAVDGTMLKATNAFAGLKNNASQAAGAVSSTASGLTNGIGGSDHASSGSNLTTVFTWKDAQGVTHYSSEEPINQLTSTVTVDPNVNVLAPVRAPIVEVRTRASDNEAADQQSGSASLRNGTSSASTRNSAARASSGQTGDANRQDVADQLGGSLPGVAGQVLSTSSGAEGGALDPAQLLRMLQP